MPASSSENAFNGFLQCRRNDLQRIARQSADQLGLQEMASEAWIAADVIGTRRKLSLNFANPVDQETLLGYLYSRLVKYPHRSVRYAARLDQSLCGDGEEPGPTLASLLVAPHDSDPQIRQMLQEESESFRAVVRSSYSQAAAYVLLLIRVEWQLGDLASMLWISVETLRKRLRSCAELAGVQSSLFDGIDSIDENFSPTRRPRSMLWQGVNPMA
ncbi:hypothetical protein [Rhodanobacter sp. Root561]|uniref:hypothetical protein n=1 Tax=Rhodanobacter sp. Root561 TaxID=1736560 RepID=UPI000ABA35D7|nr:hypothetical protein [Rhodanobacter sp. Root561]